MGKKCLYCGKEDLNSKRTTRKYCNDNCKQLAYYKRKGSTLSGSQEENAALSVKETVTVKEPLTVKSPEPESTPAVEKPEEVMPAATEDRGESDTVKENIIVKPEEKNTAIKKLPEESYEWEESNFLNNIQGYINIGHNEQYMFQRAHEYWAGDTLGVVRWITQCLLCLIESMIQLSNRRYIDAHTLFEIADAFNKLAGSYSYGFLPTNYPYKNLIKELQHKMNGMTHASEEKAEVRFRLSPERKAKLIAIKFIIGNFVPKIKFSELELPIKTEIKL